ncbi:MAG TPA: N-acetyl-alpha-D-glucosaminyl L-malate synthase BshA [Candidatus Eisenbacteria bacterium]|nr:N-acetyl-alpha-D-glucosaminyl L-malate synthase BshA [Candidatus Eisenbacteria bacterium]
MQSVKVGGIAQSMISFLQFLEKNKRTDIDIVGIDIIRKYSPTDEITSNREVNNNVTVVTQDFFCRKIQDVLPEISTLQELENEYAPVIEFFKEKIKKEKPNLIVINGTYFIPWCLYLASKSFQIPTVIHYHGIITKETETWDAHSHLLMKQMEQTFDNSRLQYIFPSVLAKEVVEKEVFGHPIAQSAILPNAISSHFFDIPVGKISKNIGIVGRWTNIKNPQFVKDFIAYNKKNNNYFDIFVITDMKDVSPEDEKFLRKSVHLFEGMSPADLGAFYADMGIILCPSHFESYGNVPQEAIASGTPAFIGNNMGVAETFRMLGLDEYIVDFSSVKEIYERAKEMSGQKVDTEIRQKMKKALSSRSVNTELLNIYTRTVKTMRKQKIGIGIVCSPWLGGSGIVGSELAKYLSRDKRYKVVFIADEFPFRLQKDDIIFHKVEKLHHALFTHPLSEAALTDGIVKAVIKHKLSIIHAHFAIPFAHCAIQAKDILEKMGIHIFVITTLHGTDVLQLGNEAPSIMPYILDRSDIVTTPSLDLAVKTKRLYKTKKDVLVINNFVDSQNFLTSTLPRIKRSMYAKPEEKVFVHISNFRPIKRVQDTLKVFLQVHKKIPSVLLLIGEGPDIDAARKFAKSMKKENFIHFIGRVKNPYAYLRIADGLIITSSYESFSLAALEALASSVPVFAMRVGGISEVIQHRKSGYFAKFGDIAELSQYIAEHFSQEKKVLDMKKQAFQRSKDFDVEKIIPLYKSLYEKLMLP